MPKVKRTDQQEQDAITRSYVAKGMAREKITYEQLGVKMHSSRQTQKNKFDRPNTYTLGELRDLKGILHLSDAEFTSLILGIEVMQVVRA